MANNNCVKCWACVMFALRSITKLKFGIVWRRRHRHDKCTTCSAIGNQIFANSLDWRAMSSNRFHISDGASSQHNVVNIIYMQMDHQRCIIVSSHSCSFWKCPPAYTDDAILRSSTLNGGVCAGLGFGWMHLSRFGFLHNLHSIIEGTERTQQQFLRFKSVGDLTVCSEHQFS